MAAPAHESPNDDFEPDKLQTVKVPDSAIRLGAHGARYVPLHANSKRPATHNGRHGGVPWHEFYKLDEQNYGIVLDGWAIVVDHDRDCPEARAMAQRLEQTPTWSQKTRRGRHWLFLLPPGALVRGCKLRDAKGEVFGEILSLAYIVGPNSAIDGKVVYECTRDADPREAPAWLVADANEAAQRDRTTSSAETELQDRIPAGERDNVLSATLGAIQLRARLTEAALSRVAQRLIETAIEDPEGFLRKDSNAVSRLVRSAMGYADRHPERDGIELLPDNWETGDMVDLAPHPAKYVVAGFFAAVGVSLMYGNGKTGKSGLGAWIAAQQTAEGHAVVFIESGETTFADFVRMVALYPEAHPELVMRYPNASDFVLPSSAEQLDAALEMIPGVTLVFLDAVYSHFDPKVGGNVAERARHCLRPLNEVATRRTLAILGTIHENAAGNMLGSLEMRNVARSICRVVREETSTTLKLIPKGANVPQVDYIATFEGEAIELRDPETKKVLTYTGLFGEEIPQVIYRLGLGEKLASGTFNEEGADLNKVPSGRQPRVSDADALAVTMAALRDARVPLSFDEVKAKTKISEKLLRKALKNSVVEPVGDARARRYQLRATGTQR